MHVISDFGLMKFIREKVKLVIFECPDVAQSLFETLNLSLNSSCME